MHRFALLARQVLRIFRRYVRPTADMTHVMLF